MKTTGPDAATVREVWARDGGRCVACGTPVQFAQRGWAWSVQHRLPRGRGGGNELANLIVACGSATTGCHGRMESERAWAYEHGYLVLTGADPANAPVFYRDRGFVILGAAA